MTDAERRALGWMLRDKLGLYPLAMLLGDYSRDESPYAPTARRKMLNRMVQKGWVEPLKPDGYRVTDLGREAAQNAPIRARTRPTMAYKAPDLT